MIKTTQEVEVPKLNAERDEKELKTVYAEISEIKIIKDSYIIKINEFVYDIIETTDIDGIPTTFEQKRNLVTIPRIRSKEKLSGLINILKDETQLTAYGMTDLIGVYDSLNQLERNDFVAEVGHLIENNKDVIRGTTWEKYVKPIETNDTLK